ncbi:Filamin ABP280 repeat-containing protein, putative [Babesia ovata]|uniref:Filamin ABP280 repeat-containing protein, putative n=1 Tax=Babesia ovata TaxID=189622 RepID=A0A2H6KBA1_9APIC|nr:Filamin ABP280 repeat-containing protein, putative [Babesia ovata]GBE60267.1 Filamin ABP280 repeat-containing protein, putative [Babesia ovata]
MIGCAVHRADGSAAAHSRNVSAADHVIAQPSTTYVDGDGIYGGECGKWLKFVVRKTESVTRGVLRLNLEYADDAFFRSSVFLTSNHDERDMLHNAPSCHNNTLVNNSVADALEHIFTWDVCVVDRCTFNVRYRVTRKGTYSLHVKLDGNPLPGSPFRIYISEGAPSTAACRVYGRNVGTCCAIPYVPEIMRAIFPNMSPCNAMSREHVRAKRNATRAASCDAPTKGASCRNEFSPSDNSNRNMRGYFSNRSAASAGGWQGGNFSPDEFLISDTSPQAAFMSGGSSYADNSNRNETNFAHAHQSAPDQVYRDVERGTPPVFGSGTGRGFGYARRSISSDGSLSVNFSGESAATTHSHIKESPRAPTFNPYQNTNRKCTADAGSRGNLNSGRSFGPSKSSLHSSEDDMLPMEFTLGADSSALPDGRTTLANEPGTVGSCTRSSAVTSAPWDGMDDITSSESTRKRRQHALQQLERRGLLNEIEIRLADAHGNVVTHALPYIQAWGENYARVVSVDNRPNGVVTVKYVVVVPRDGLESLKAAQLHEGDSVMPHALRVGGVPCKINVEIDGKPVFGSPFHPHVGNVNEVEHYFESTAGTTECLVQTFTDLVRNNDFDGCAELYSMVETDDVKDKLTGILLTRLSELEKANIAATSNIRLVESLKLQSLGRLLELVQSQYKKMLTYKTSSIVDCIRELKSFENMATDQKGSRSPSDHKGEAAKRFNNLGDVILNYRLIGDELRKLHRYELADKFDQINNQMCDEIDLGMWTSIIGHKESQVEKLRAEVESAADRLTRFKEAVDERYQSFTRKDLADFRGTPGFAFEHGTQTEAPELLTTRLSSLVRGRCVPITAHSEVDKLVEAYWRKCNNYDIQTTVSKVLKSSVRLKNSISELFMFYSTAHPRENGRTMLGVSRASMELFVLQSRLNNYLTANVQKLDWLFERFSIELPSGGTDGSTPPPRAIPEHLWCAYLREIGYLNLLYTIAESGDREMLRDNQHPSRLVAFHHLCKEHLIPLYEMLFTTKPEFQKCLKFTDSKVDSGSQRVNKSAKKTSGTPTEQYFRSRHDILSYFNVHALEHVLNVLDIDVLQRVFKHYSRISMFGRQQVARDWFDEKTATISTATFVVFARDFQIIPGHMDGESVHAIARSVALRGAGGANKLALRDFVSAVSRTLARVVLASCLAKHDAYERVRDSIAETMETAPRCVQSKESVKRDIVVLLQLLGICNLQFVRYTIDAIYGSDAVEQMDEMSAVSHIVRHSGDVWSLHGLIGGIGGVTLRHLLRRRYGEAAAAVKKVIYPEGLHQGNIDTSHVAITPHILPKGCCNTPILDELYRRTSNGLSTVLEGLHILLWKGKQFKGKRCCLPLTMVRVFHTEQVEVVPPPRLLGDAEEAAEVRHVSAPQVCHRWPCDNYRRYHEVRGPGKRAPSKWEDQSFYKPLRDSIKFW